MTKQGGCFKRPNFIMGNHNRNIVRRMLVLKFQELVVVQGLVGGAAWDCWCKTGSHWESGLVVTGAGLVVAVVGLVAAGAEK